MANSTEAMAWSAKMADGMDLLTRILPPELVDEWEYRAAHAVYTSSAVVWMMVYQRWNPHASLHEAVSTFLNEGGLRSDDPRVRHRTLSTNTGAYSRARSRLALDVATKSADHVFTTLLATHPAVKGGRTFLIDGTTLSLSSNDTLRAVWPPQSNQHGVGTWPIAHLTLACDMDSGLMLRPEVGAMSGPNAQSEVSLAIAMLPRIPKGSVLMADRGFGVFGFAWEAVQAGHTVLTRLTKSRFKALKNKATLMKDTGRWRITWAPTNANRKTHPDLPADARIDAYLYEFVGVSGETMWCMATRDWPTEDIADRYLKRKEIETDLRSWKGQLNVDCLRGRSEDMVMKEIAMAALANNLVVEVRRLAAAKATPPISPRRISYAGVWSLVSQMLLGRFDRTAEEWQKMFNVVLRGALQRKIPNRPGRNYPRTVIPRRRKFPERPRKNTDVVE